MNDSLKDQFKLLSLLQVDGPDITGWHWEDSEGREIDYDISESDKRTSLTEGVDIFKVSSSSPTVRTAQTIDDFKKIFYRELKIVRLQPSRAAVALFSRQLIEEVDRCIELHKKACPEPLKQDISLLLIANEFKDWLFTVQSGVSSTSSARPQPYFEPNGKPIEALDDLFYDSKQVEPAIQILSKVTPPLLNYKGTFLGKHKAALKIWLDELAYKGIIKPLPNEKTLARLLETKFCGLSLAKDGSTLRKQSPTADSEYKVQIKLLVSQLSLNG